MRPASFGQTPPAGWYPDNSVYATVGQQRYWDGSAWTSAWRVTASTVPITVRPTVAEPAVEAQREHC